MTFEIPTLETLKEWLNYSINIGSFKITPADVLVAVVAFIAIQTLSRLFRRLLQSKILPRTHFDAGLKNSITTFSGYIGTLIGLLVALSVLGINLSSIALIAGALSVGIGFGLQNIVNNFVSGIILLIERPIKVGDWIVIGNNEGIVTQIRVRATEIETFQRANVIIPNSDLLQNAVKNLSYQDRTARVEIPVDVDYSSDIDKVERVLKECATSYPNAAKNPEPYVYFKDFGGSGLRFEVRFYINDVGDILQASHDMRKRIFKAFKAEDIHVPFNIMDLRVGDDSLAQSLMKARS